MLKYGLIGTGFGATVYAEALKYHSMIQPFAIFGRNPRTTKVVKREYGFKKIYDSWSDLIQHSGIEVVFISTPPVFHYEMCKLALENNIHVCVSAPFTLTVKEAEELEQLAKERKLVAVVDHHMNYFPARKYVQKLVRDHRIGKLLRIERVFKSDARFSSEITKTWKFQRSALGGIFPVQSSHDLDFMLRVAGGVERVWANLHNTYIRKITSEAETFISDVEDAYSLSLVSHSGVECSSEVSAVYKGKPIDEFIFYGTEGSIHLINNLEILFFDLQTGKRERIPIPPGYQVNTIPGSASSASFYTLVDLMINSIYGQGSVSPTFDEAIHVQRILNAAYQSHYQKRWVEIEEIIDQEDNHLPGAKSSVKKIFE